MNCIICNDICNKYDGKEWVSLKNDNYFKDFKPIVQYCSYLCYHRNRKSLPKDHWKNVLNKEDFECPLPVIPKKNDTPFEYLTYSEYIQLSDEEKIEYESKKETYQFLNPENIHFYNEQYEEDKRTYDLENCENTDSEYCTDDY